jgi:hypothetical protein
MCSCHRRRVRLLCHLHVLKTGGTDLFGMCTVRILLFPDAYIVVDLKIYWLL